MSEIASMRELLASMKAGGRLRQEYLPRFPLSLRRREVFYLEHGDQRRVVRIKVFLQALRSRRIELAPPFSNGLTPQAWRLTHPHTLSEVVMKFTKHESSGVHVVVQHKGLLDGWPLMWTRDNVGEGEMTLAQAKAAIEKMNAEKYAGFDDWRLPSVEELFLLADRTKFNPAIDTEFFPACESDWYWSSTPAASSPGDYAWIILFANGDSGWDRRGNEAFVRAVRASQ